LNMENQRKRKKKEEKFCYLIKVDLNVFFQIAKNLEVNEIRALGRTCRKFNEWSDNDILWRCLVMRDFGLMLKLKEKENYKVIYKEEKRFVKTWKHLNLKNSEDLYYIIFYSAHLRNHIQSVLRRVVNINWKNRRRRGCTLLHTACVNGHKILVQILLERGADINATNNDGDTPLYLACANGRRNVVRALVKKGAEVNIANNRGRTPFYSACMKRKSLFLCELLRDGVDIRESPGYYSEKKNRQAFLDYRRKKIKEEIK